jgi:hypothetical protein
VIEWCRANAAVAGQLLAAARRLVAARLDAELAELGDTPADDLFDGTCELSMQHELLSLYLSHNLYVRLLELEDAGYLGACLMAGLRSGLVRRARRMFSQSLGERAKLESAECEALGARVRSFHAWGILPQGVRDHLLVHLAALPGTRPGSSRHLASVRDVRQAHSSHAFPAARHA